MQAAETPQVEEAIQQALEDESSSSQSSNVQEEAYDIPTVEEQIQQALADESMTELYINGDADDPPPLTVIDSQCIIECLQQTPRVDTLTIHGYSLHDDAVLNVLRDGLPLCTSITTVHLNYTHLTSEDLDRLRPAFYNTSITKLIIWHNHIQGQRGGEVLRDLLRGNNTLRELDLSHSHNFGPEFAIGIKQGLAVNNRLQILSLYGCNIGNDLLANLLPADGIINTSLTNLDLWYNNIQGEDGGRQLCLLLQRFPALKVLHLVGSNLGPLGARALAPGLAAASHLEMLDLRYCWLGNDSVANLVLDGQVNRSLMNLDLGYNGIEVEDGGRQLCLLLQRCPVLKVLHLNSNNLGPLGARALAPGLAAARHLESLELFNCGLGNDGVANLILPEGQVNRSLTNLDLGNNGIEGEDGGRQVSLLMLRCPVLKVLHLNSNNLGPLGARALAPGLAAAANVEELALYNCGLGNVGVANLIPDGQVNRSLMILNIGDNDMQGLEGGENVIALAARCTSLYGLGVGYGIFSLEQRCRVGMLLDQNRLCTEASALGGSTFPVLFHFVENAHRHENGLSAIFVILQNDGDDYFCTALNRSVSGMDIAQSVTGGKRKR